MASRIMSPAGLSDTHLFYGRKTVRDAQDYHNLDSEDVVLLHPGDDTSSGLPYWLGFHIRDSQIHYRDARYQPQTADIDEMRVLVYVKNNVPRYMPPDVQIYELEAFALTFPEGSLIRELIHHNLINWLRRNKDRPDIWRELVSTKNELHRCEDALRRHESETELSHDND